MGNTKRFFIDAVRTEEGLYLHIVNKCLVGSKKCELFHEDLKIKQVFFCSRPFGRC